MEHNIIINASPEAIETYLSSPQNWMEWYPDVVFVEDDGLFPGVGGQIRLITRTTGLRFKMTMTVTEHIPYQQLTLHLEGMLCGDCEYRLRRDNNGATRCIVRFFPESADCTLTRYVDPLMAERMISGHLRAGLNNLKYAMENQASSDDPSHTD